MTMDFAPKPIGYPVSSRLDLLDSEMTQTFLDFMFGYLNFENRHRIILRGTGEKGTPREGEFVEPIALKPNQLEAVQHHVERWVQWDAASYILPAVCWGDKATEENIALMPCVVVDIDKGDTDKALEHASLHMGRPHMVVQSGGTTETGSRKVHAYWRLTEPTDRCKDVGAVQHMLALKIGGDPAFGRITQVIRIPGSLNLKNREENQCAILAFENDQADYELDELIQAACCGARGDRRMARTRLGWTPEGDGRATGARQVLSHGGGQEEQPGDVKHGPDAATGAVRDARGCDGAGQLQGRRGELQ